MVLVLYLLVISTVLVESHILKGFRVPGYGKPRYAGGLTFAEMTHIFPAEAPLLRGFSTTLTLLKKARTGFEPAIFGLRDRRLTTWPPRLRRRFHKSG